MENIKDLFKLELKDDKLICPGLARRIKDLFVEDSELLKKIRALPASNTSYTFHKFPITYLLTYNEIEQLRELGVRLYFKDEALSFSVYKNSGYFMLSLKLIEDKSAPTASNFIQETYSFDSEFENISHFRLTNPVVVRVHHGGESVTDDRNWGLIPILSKWRTKDIIDFENQTEICMCIDSSMNSLLNIIDVIRIRQEKIMDCNFVAVAKDIDSISFEYIKSKYGISDLLKNSFYRFSLHGYELLTFGKLNNIPELLDLDNCCLLSMLIGDYLFRGCNSPKFPVRKMGLFSKSVTLAYRLYHVYMVSLAAVLGLPEDKILEKLSDENFQGVGLIPKDKFSEFFDSIKRKLRRLCKEDRRREIESVKLKLEQEKETNRTFNEAHEKLKEISAVFKKSGLEEKISEFDRLADERITRRLMNSVLLDKTEKTILRALSWHKLEDTFPDLPKFYAHP